MKYKLRHKILIAAVLVLTAVSCEKNVGGTGSVTLNIGVGGTGLSVETGPWSKADGYVDATQYEGLYTVRVIVTSGQSGSRIIHYNDKDSLTSDQGTAKGYSCTIDGLPIGTALTFYVIANEESLDADYSTIEDNFLVNHKILYVEEQEDINSRHFPKTGPELEKSGKGLPMSGWTETPVTLTDTDPVSVRVDLDRSVVKLSLKVYNETNEDITLSSVTFGDFFGDRFYMFRETTLDVPNDSKYLPKTYEAVNIPTIPAYNPSTHSEFPSVGPLSLYLYPTDARKEEPVNNPYTIALTTADPTDPTKHRTYSALEFAPEEKYFTRNNVIHINAYISTSGVKLEFQVSDWDDYTIVHDEIDFN